MTGPRSIGLVILMTIPWDGVKSTSIAGVKLARDAGQAGLEVGAVDRVIRGGARAVLGSGELNWQWHGSGPPSNPVSPIVGTAHT